MIRLSAGINKCKKNVGKDDLYMIYTTHYASPLGDLLLAENENQLIGLWLEGQKYYRGSLREAAQERSDRAVFAQTADWLDRYFAGEQPAVWELSLAPREVHSGRQCGKSCVKFLMARLQPMGKSPVSWPGSPG